MTLSTVNQKYIDGCGANEKEFLRLTEKFMPADGNVPNNLVGEVFASAYRIYYEFHNNGNENALDVIEGESERCNSCCGRGYNYSNFSDATIPCEVCGGQGSIYTLPTIEISKEFNKMLGLLSFALDVKEYPEIDDILENINYIILNSKDEEFFNALTPEDKLVYDNLIDCVVDWTLKHEYDKNISLPKDY